MGKKLALELKKRDVVTVNGVKKVVANVRGEVWSDRLVVRFKDRSTKFYDPTDAVEVE